MHCQLLHDFLVHCLISTGHAADDHTVLQCHVVCVLGSTLSVRRQLTRSLRLLQLCFWRCASRSNAWQDLQHVKRQEEQKLGKALHSLPFHYLCFACCLTGGKYYHAISKEVQGDADLQTDLL